MIAAVAARHFSGVRPNISREHRNELALSVPLDPGNPDDLAGVQLEGHVTQGATDADPSQPEHHLARSLALPLARVGLRLPVSGLRFAARSHDCRRHLRDLRLHVGSVPALHLTGEQHLAAPHHGDDVGVCPHLIHLVGHDDDARTRIG